MVFPQRSPIAHGLLLLLVSLAAASAEPTGGEKWFDIPSQMLDQALDSFSSVTEMALTYDGNLIAGRLSNTVRGRMTREAALSLLLQDTGLQAEYTSTDAFVVVPMPPRATLSRTPTAIAAAALSQQSTTEQRYSGTLQANILQVLCAREETKPGTFRLAMNFRITASGQVTQFKLLGSTGDQHRDSAIVDMVGHASIGEPPVHMPQPFTMVLLPRSAGGDAACPPSQSTASRG